jgi:arylsulfatase A-like enzyme
MCDQMHRIDHNVGLVLAAVDALNVPYVVVLSADHGGSDFTERLAERGYPAYRIAGPAVLARVNAQLRGELGLSAAPLKGSLDELMVEVADADRARVTAAAVRVLAAQPEVAAVFTQEELLATPVGHGLSPEELTLKQRYARGAYRGRNADILVALPPYTQLGVPNPGSNLATHTGPWDYDRRVPILFWWKGAPSQTRAMPVETVDIAPTLAALLGLTPPADVDGRCLPLAEKGPAACPNP